MRKLQQVRLDRRTVQFDDLCVQQIRSPLSDGEFHQAGRSLICMREVTVTRQFVYRKSTGGRYHWECLLTSHVS